MQCSARKKTVAICSLWHLAAFATIGYEVIFQRLRRFLPVHFARRFQPFRPVEFREPGIADHIPLNLGDVQRIRQAERLVVRPGSGRPIDSNVLRPMIR